jgi:hypothetical protein
LWGRRLSTGFAHLPVVKITGEQVLYPATQGGKYVVNYECLDVADEEDESLEASSML